MGTHNQRQKQLRPLSRRVPHTVGFYTIDEHSHRNDTFERIKEIFLPSAVVGLICRLSGTVVQRRPKRRDADPSAIVEGN